MMKTAKPLPPGTEGKKGTPPATTTLVQNRSPNCYKTPGCKGRVIQRPMVRGGTCWHPPECDTCKKEHHNEKNILKVEEPRPA